MLTISKTLTSIRIRLFHNLYAGIGSRAIATCARSPTRSGRMVDDPEDVLTDRNVRPNKETAEDVVNVFGQHVERRSWAR